LDDTAYGQAVAVGDLDNDGWLDVYSATSARPSVPPIGAMKVRGLTRRRAFDYGRRRHRKLECRASFFDFDRGRISDLSSSITASSIRTFVR